jgi:Ca2+-binding EF-hand superfamily protein
MTDVQFDTLINSLDKNDDDKIEFEEFYNVMSTQFSKINRKEDLKRTFDYFDSGKWSWYNFNINTLIYMCTTKELFN